MISLRGLEVSLNHRKILAGVSLDTVPQGVVALMGPSGCGKSTLLKALMGIHPCDGGEISANSKNFPASNWSSSQNIFTLVPQVPLLLPWKTILENVALAGNTRESKDSNNKKASEFLKIVGLSDAESLYPWQVSQGMAARASFARTLMIESQVLLLDEPFAAIDATTRFRLQQWLIGKISELKIQAVLVTHDPREALIVADKVVVLGDKPAKILQTFDLPPRSKRNEPEWIFGPEAGHFEKQIRLALEPSDRA